MPMVAEAPQHWLKSEALAGIEATKRPILAFGTSVAAIDWEHDRHSHDVPQLLYTYRGIMNCEVESGIWTVPADCALWIPAGQVHAANGSGDLDCCCVFIAPERTQALPREVCTVGVSPLLRALISRVASYDEARVFDEAAERLMATLLDELVAAPITDLHLPVPSDPRLRRLTSMMLAAPADKSGLDDWAERIGMSRRSLSRLLHNDMGMSLGQWRCKLHAVLAMQKLSEGQSVHAVALDLGYESAGSFVTMFRRTVGAPPARYAKALGVIH